MFFKTTCRWSSIHAHCSRSIEWLTPLDCLVHCLLNSKLHQLILHHRMSAYISFMRVRFKFFYVKLFDTLNINQHSLFMLFSGSQLDGWTNHRMVRKKCGITPVYKNLCSKQSHWSNFTEVFQMINYICWYVSLICLY